MRPGRRRQQSGFTYLFALLMVAVTTATAAAVAQAWSVARQREKEAELIWIGNQFKTAIGLYYQRSPGSVKRYPEKLEDLLADRRYLTTQRYLRRIYIDPVSGKADWETIAASQGGIAGIRSTSKKGSLKTELEATYAPEVFIYEPPGHGNENGNK